MNSKRDQAKKLKALAPAVECAILIQEITKKPRDQPDKVGCVLCMLNKNVSSGLLEAVCKPAPELKGNLACSNARETLRVKLIATHES